MIVFYCAGCGNLLEAAPALAGRQLECPDCRTLTLVPSLQAVPSSAGAPVHLANTMPSIRREPVPMWRRLALLAGIPVLVGLLALAAVLWRFPDRDAPDGNETTTAPASKDKNTPTPVVSGFPLDRAPRLHYEFGVNAALGKTFGLTIIETGKKLTFDARGKTNSLLLRIDGTPVQFGARDRGEWLEETHPTPAAPGHPFPSTRTKNVWVSRGKQIRVSQVIEIIPGVQPVRRKSGEASWLLDRCLAVYLVENSDVKPHVVGMRVLLDTLIGDRDGVPFAAPGLSAPVVDSRDFVGASVPPFIQASELPDLGNPGVVARLGLKVGGDVEPPNRVSLTAWSPNLAAWEVPVVNMDQDSCTVLYWPEQSLKPGQRRCLGFTYGLGHLVAVGRPAPGNFQMALTVDGNFTPGGEFTVLAYARHPKAGQTLRLVPPPGLACLRCAEQQKIPDQVPGEAGLVTWTLRAEKAGEFELTLETTLNGQVIRGAHSVVITPADPARRLTIKNLFD